VKYTVDQIIQFVLDQDRASLQEQVKFYKLGQEGKIPPTWEKFIPKPTEAELRMEKHPLQFEYCECGCKCHSGSSKGIGYSIFNDLKSKLAFTLKRGHGWMGTQIGPKYATFSEAVIAAQADWDKIP
jgi:hypothetical protein